MTADSNLFVSEIVRDIVQGELNDLFPGIKGDFFVKVPERWSDIWDPSRYPDEGETEIVHEVPHPTEISEKLTGEVVEYMSGKTVKEVSIATVRWDTDFSVENGMGGRYIAAMPEITGVEPKISRKKWLALELNGK